MQAGAETQTNESIKLVYSVGIDIGSTATKLAVMDSNGALVHTDVRPTGFSSVEVARFVREDLASRGFLDESRVVATGYGRVSADWADKVVTEISCHGRGAAWLFGADGVVIDVGGQDTKVIHLRGGRVVKFAMNDKCAAGTGRFLEVMADRLALSQQELADLARVGKPITISSMCTVFAESEVISLVGKGEARENIARGVIDSVVGRVATLVSSSYKDPSRAGRTGRAGHSSAETAFFLTGGLCENDFVVERLSVALGVAVETQPEARFAGALGAALCARDLCAEVQVHGN